MQDDTVPALPETAIQAPKTGSGSSERRLLLSISAAAIVLAVLLAVVPFVIVQIANSQNAFSSSEANRTLSHGKHRIRLEVVVLHPTVLRVNDSALLTVVLAANKSDIDGDVHDYYAARHKLDILQRLFLNRGQLTSPAKLRALPPEVTTILRSYKDPVGELASEVEDISALQDAVQKSADATKVAVLKQNINLQVLPVNANGGVSLEPHDARALGAIDLPRGYYAIRIWQWLMSSDKPGSRAIVEDWTLNGERTTAVQEIVFAEPWISPENIPTTLAIVSGLVGFAAALIGLLKPAN